MDGTSPQTNQTLKGYTIMNGNRDTAQRIVNARQEFINSIVDQFQFTAAEAETILEVFRDAKAVKLDPVMGKYNLTHGAFWDKEVMTRALQQAAPTVIAEGYRIAGTYARLAFTGTVYEMKNGTAYIVVDEPYHQNLPVARSLIPGRPATLSFRTTDLKTKRVVIHKSTPPA